MLKKALIYGSGLVLATTGPISLYTGTDIIANAKKSWSSPPAVEAAANPGTASTPAALPSDPTSPTLAPVAAIPAGPVANRDATLPTPSIAEAFNFDVTIDGVMRRWPRVSTGLAQVQLQGYRVPLVTGTGPTDLAGSLTYYFNSQQQVQQITFRGVTGDASELVALIASRYQFTRRLTNDPGVILYEAADSSNHTTGVVKIRSAGVIKANQPHSRFDIDLTINRPQ